MRPAAIVDLPHVRRPRVARRGLIARGRRGFTLIELLVVLAIVVILMGILIPTLSAARRSGAQVKCLSNLRQIGFAFFQYANENRGFLPDPGQSRASWESMIAPKLQGSKVFECGGDEELFPMIGSSYDWRDTGDPATTLAGSRLTMAPPDCVLTFEALPGWHFKRAMNAVLTDGSGHRMTDRECLGNLAKIIRIPNDMLDTAGKKKKKKTK